MAGERLTSGVTLDMVHKKLALAVAGAGVIDPSRVWLVLEDSQIPKLQMPSQNFVTVRLPSLTWQYGDVFHGGGQVGSFDLVGQSRVTLWLNNDLDLYGTARKLMTEAASPPPFGNRMLGNLIKLFWDQDLMDADPWVTVDGVSPSGDYILKRPMKFISLELPPDTSKGPHPFRMTWEMYFTWDLTSGG